MLDYNAFQTIVAIDANVILEGKPIGSQNWTEIDPIGPILVLVVPQVQSEIDRKKQDGRVGVRAREFNRLIAPVAGKSTIIIRDSVPIVELAFAICNKIDWDKTDFVRSEGDHCIVAQMLNINGLSSDRVTLVSQDIGPLVIARQHNISTYHLPQSWLLPKEPSPQDKEISRLKSKLTALEKAEPEWTVEIKFDPKSPPTAYQVIPLDDYQKKVLTNAILYRHPFPNKFAYVTKVSRSLLSGEDLFREEHYPNYRDFVVPKYADNLHNRLQPVFNQVPLRISIQNSGEISAINMIIEIRSDMAELNERFYFTNYIPPTPPNKSAPQDSHFMQMIAQSEIGSHLPPGEHEIVYSVEPQRSDYAEIHCKDFRHGRTWDFEGFLYIEPDPKGEVQLSIRITAQNMRGEHIVTKQLNYESTACSATDLFDIEKLGLKVEFPAQEFLRQLPSDEREDRLEFAKDEDLDEQIE